jgi:cyanophycinase
VSVLHTRDRDEANSPSFVQPLKQATAVWLTGGQQARLEEAYVGTAVEKELLRLLERGGVIGGTSAGAAIMSKVMIRRGDPIPEIGRGFDLARSAIIDQHALRRSRINRLMEAVRRHPDRIGLGVDEDTAIIVQDKQVEVVGDSYAVAVAADKNSGRIAVHTFASGSRFSMDDLAPPKAAQPADSPASAPPSTTAAIAPIRISSGFHCKWTSCFVS